MQRIWQWHFEFSTKFERCAGFLILNGCKFSVAELGWKREWFWFGHLLSRPTYECMYATYFSNLSVRRKRKFCIASTLHGSSFPLWRFLSRQGLNPVKLAYNQVGRMASSIEQPAPLTNWVSMPAVLGLLLYRTRYFISSNGCNLHQFCLHT